MNEHCASLGLSTEDPKSFFTNVVVSEMQRARFQNPYIRVFLPELCTNYLCSTDRFHLFYAPHEPALAFELPNADWGKLEIIGEQLLFGIGFFPESFRARGKRIVGLPYYIGVEKAIAHKLGRWNERWAEVDEYFPTVIGLLGRVRSRIVVDRLRIIRLGEDVEAIEPLAFF